mmetsp:Transcript_35279/g.69619  ORF Transcript_35279/g.69619 Transcript_35279/m.69619 type:complete len:121 (+) Transcript_35279:1698-2060(+)
MRTGAVCGKTRHPSLRRLVILTVTDTVCDWDDIVSVAWVAAGNEVCQVEEVGPSHIDLRDAGAIESLPALAREHTAAQLPPAVKEGVALREGIIGLRLGIMTGKELGDGDSRRSSVSIFT